MKVKAFLFAIICLLATVAMGQKAKHSGTTHDWLTWFEATFVQHIWLPLTYYTFYKFLPDILCEMNLQDYIFDLFGSNLPGVNNTTAKAAVKATAAATCKSGFEAMYNNVWYFNDQKKLIDGDWDYYNYTPSG